MFPITIPPLRDRVEDIPALAWTFVDEFAGAFGKRIEEISSRSMTELQQYPWPGNVRELRNVIERAVILESGPTLSPTIAGSKGSPRVSGSIRLDDVQAEHIRSILDRYGWHIRTGDRVKVPLLCRPR